MGKKLSDALFDGIRGSAHETVEEKGERGARRAEDGKGAGVERRRGKL